MSRDACPMSHDLRCMSRDACRMSHDSHCMSHDSHELRCMSHDLLLFSQGARISHNMFNYVFTKSGINIEIKIIDILCVLITCK